MIKKIASPHLLVAAALCASSLAQASDMYSSWVDASYYPTRIGEHGNQNSIRQTSAGADTAIIDIQPAQFNSLTPQLLASSNHNDLRAFTSMHIEGESRSLVSWTDVFTNSGRDNQSYAMHINLQDIALTLPMLHYDRSNFQASFAVDVLYRGFNIWHSSQTLEESRDFNGNTSFSYRKEGVDIGNFVTESGSLNDYQGRNTLNDYSTTIDLGTLLGTSHLPGEGFDSSQVTYRLSTFTKWLSPEGCIETECGQYLQANISDPFGAAGSGPRVAIVAVPEADTWAMMLAGFGVIGFITRRRQRSPK